VPAVRGEGAPRGGPGYGLRVPAVRQPGARRRRPDEVAAPAPAAPPTPDPAASRPPPWKVALVAFLVLGAAYVGAYLLLTAEARRDRAALKAVRGEAMLSAPDPGAAPPGDDARAVGAWRRAKELWEDRRRHEELSDRVHTMLAGMLGAFALQAVLTAVLLAKASKRATGRPPTSGAPGRSA